VAGFYSARGRTIPPLPWPTFTPPLSDICNQTCINAFTFDEDISGCNKAAWKRLEIRICNDDGLGLAKHMLRDKLAEFFVIKPPCKRAFQAFKRFPAPAICKRLVPTGQSLAVTDPATKTQLLILDDWGPDRLNASQRRDLMEIVEDRYEVGSTLITSQLPIDKWHDVIGEPTFADAILDRLVHNAYRVELDGQSMRKTKLGTGDESTQN
jgi:hypothetical protein